MDGTLNGDKQGAGSAAELDSTSRFGARRDEGRMVPRLLDLLHHYL